MALVMATALASRRARTLHTLSSDTRGERISIYDERVRSRRISGDRDSSDGQTRWSRGSSRDRGYFWDE